MSVSSDYKHRYPAYPRTDSLFTHDRAQAPRWFFTTEVSSVTHTNRDCMCLTIFDYPDLTDTTNLVYIMSSVQPTEVYNLAAQSHVKVSFDMAEYTVSRQWPCSCCLLLTASGLIRVMSTV